MICQVGHFLLVPSSPLCATVIDQRAGQRAVRIFAAGISTLGAIHWLANRLLLGPNQHNLTALLRLLEWHKAADFKVTLLKLTRAGIM